ncbi:MAG: hypothetical protein U0W24_15590 [Bacteroidales bacterium]
MQHYIEQLIRDLRDAKNKVPATPDFGNTQEEFNAAMDAIVHAPELPPKKVFGVSYEELPPAEKLSEVQMQQIIGAITDTLDAFGVSVHLKAEMPISFKYELLREQFTDSIPYMPGWNIDFCSGWCPDCRILGYCDSWKNTWTIEEIEKERTKKT